MKKRAPNRYSRLIEDIFARHHKPGTREFEFERWELEQAAAKLAIVLPKNLGDVIYSFRFRTPLPERVLKTCAEGEAWLIEGAGKGKYRFRLSKGCWIGPTENLVRILIPDATPQIIEIHAMNDEQALLAKVRYNRLIDLFTGIVCYSLQNHLRTTVKEMGQIEVDELYVGVSKKGERFILPVQAKTGSDKIGVVQVAQDVALCAERFEGLTCRPIAVHTLPGDGVAMFELLLEDGELRIVEERHYELLTVDAPEEE